MPEIDFHGVGYSIYAPGTSFGPYTVLPYELVWIDEGDASLTANGQTYELSPNTVILSRPGDRNTYHWDPEHTTRHGYLYFSTATADPPAPQLRHLAGDDVILSLLRHVRWLDAERPDQWQDLAGQALRYAVRAFSTGASRTSGPSDQRIPAVIQRSLALIRQQWAPGGPLHTPTLSELADAAAVTPRISMPHLQERPRLQPDGGTTAPAIESNSRAPGTKQYDRQTSGPPGWVRQPVPFLPHLQTSIRCLSKRVPPNPADRHRVATHDPPP